MARSDCHARRLNVAPASERSSRLITRRLLSGQRLWARPNEAVTTQSMRVRQFGTTFLVLSIVVVSGLAIGFALAESATAQSAYVFAAIGVALPTGVAVTCVAAVSRAVAIVALVELGVSQQLCF